MLQSILRALKRWRTGRRQTVGTIYLKDLRTGEEVELELKGFTMRYETPLNGSLPIIYIHWLTLQEEGSVAMEYARDSCHRCGLKFKKNQLIVNDGHGNLVHSICPEADTK